MGLTAIQLNQLITQAKSGKQSAYKKLLDTYWPYVYGYQLKLTKDEYWAEDITIQTFAKAFDKIGSYNPAYAFKTWLITISKNLHIDMLRKAQNSSISDLSRQDSSSLKSVADNTPSAEDELIRQQNLSLLLKMVKRLKPSYRTIIMLRYFQEMSYKEMATHLSEPINTIKVKALRARKLLAELIKNNNDLDG